MFQAPIGEGSLTQQSPQARLLYAVRIKLLEALGDHETAQPWDWGHRRPSGTP